MRGKSMVYLAILLVLGWGDVEAKSRHRARAPQAPQKMYSVQIKQDGDSLRATSVTLVKGRVKVDGPGTPGGLGSWYCEILGEDGKVAWSGFLDNPFLAGSPEAAPAASGRIGMIRLPYRRGYTQAKVFTTLAGPVPIPDRKAPILDIALASVPEN